MQSLSALKTTALAPMARAKVSRATQVKPGDFAACETRSEDRGRDGRRKESRVRRGSPVSRLRCRRISPWLGGELRLGTGLREGFLRFGERCDRRFLRGGGRPDRARCGG